VRGRRSVRVEVARDLGEGIAGGVFGTDALDELRRQDRRASARTRRAPELPRRSPPFGDESFELVDGDELRPPGKLDLRDVGEEALERRLADAERFGCLRPRVRKSLNAFGIAYEDTPMGLRVPELLLDPAADTMAGHVVHHTRTMTHFRIKMHLCPACYRAE